MTPDCSNSVVLRAASVPDDWTLDLVMIFLASRQAARTFRASPIVWVDRFGAVDVLAELQSGHQNDRVRMIRRADDQRVEVLGFFVEHLAKVPVARSLWISFEDLLGVIAVDVAQCDNVLVLAARDISLAHAAYAHGGDPKLLAGRQVSCAAQDMSRDNYKRRGDRCSLEKFTSADLFFDFINFCHGQILSIFFLVNINKFTFIIQSFRPSFPGDIMSPFCHYEC